ncbi:MAG: NAD(P)-dependent oxidoreductase [Mycobacteriales bacterium]
MSESIGFIGLGNMGSALAANLVSFGCAVVAHDVAGPDRMPVGATWVPTAAEVATKCEVVVLSLPDGSVSEAVVRDLLGSGSRRVTAVVDTSTVGVQAADRLTALLAEADVDYVAAPVSGGVTGARARTLMVMYAGSDAACSRVEPVLAGLSDRRKRVGDVPRQAQALKLVNNFLSAANLATASEALAFGESLGLDLEVMLDVINGSSGQSSVTSEKFPQQVLTGRYAAGFTNTLMTKDLNLFLSAVGEHAPLAAATTELWEAFTAAEPGADFTRVYPFGVMRRRPRPS